MLVLVANDGMCEAAFVFRKKATETLQRTLSGILAHTVVQFFFLTTFARTWKDCSFVSSERNVVIT